MKILRLICAWCLLLPFLEAASFAHSPFDISTHVIVHGDSAEVSVTMGADLAAEFLARAALAPAQVSQMRPTPLPPEMAANFFEVSADGKTLPPQQADVVTDGLEFQFTIIYVLAAPKTLGFHANFLDALPAPKNSGLALTDENGNMLGTALLAPSRATAEFPLPAALFAGRPGNLSTAAASDGLSPAQTPGASAAETVAVKKPGFGEYFTLGVGHILTGCDHLLFLVALLLGCRRLRPMLAVITGFTAAHSLTLALAALGWVKISPRIIEPLIALSIIFVALENLRCEEKTWRRYLLTCGFGLVHGFGFAGALQETGLATGGGLALPLLAFNSGVETGQLAVAAVVLPALFALRRWPWFARREAKWISWLVVLVGAFWFGQRLFAP